MVMKREFCFVTSCDSNENYFRGALTLIKSIRCFSYFPIVFLDAGLNTSQIEELSLEVDEVISIKSVIGKQFNIRHSHLNPSALASLYSHYANYSKIIYLDVDTILLGNIDFIFDLLLEHDVVAVRAGIINYLEKGNVHTVKDAIAKEAIPEVKEIFPNLDLQAVAFNTGCFGIKTSILKEWEHIYQKIFPLMPYMKYVDQSIFNLFVNAFHVKIKEISYKFNLGGSSQSLQEDNRKFKGYVQNGRPIFLYQGNQIIVPHFSGKPKPWEVVNNSPGKQIWDYFAEGNLAMERLSPSLSCYEALSNRRKLARSAPKLDSSWKTLSPVEIRDKILQKAQTDNLSDFVESDYGFGKFLMFSNNDDYVSLRNFWTGGANYELSSVWLFSYFATKSKNIIDAGAYTGVFSLAASVANPNGSIYAFEPVQEIFGRLTLNLQANLAVNIFPYNYALYNKSGFEKINYFATGQGLLRTGQSLKGKGKRFKKTFIPTIRLDKLLNIDSVCLMKLDVEESEFECLRGSRDILKKSEPIVIIECQNPNKLNNILNRFFRKKEEYVCKLVDDCPSNTNLFFESESDFWQCPHSRNVLLVPKSKQALIPSKVI